MASNLMVNTEVNKFFQSITLFIINNLKVNINDNVETVEHPTRNLFHAPREGGRK
jgi:hypothetical protein